MKTKTLLLMRHGKAEDDSPQGDKGRALTKKGERDAAAAFLARLKEILEQPYLMFA